MMKVKITDEGREITEGVAELMGYKLTQMQAERTLRLAQGSIEIAVQIAHSFKELSAQNRGEFYNYEVYLHALEEGFRYLRGERGNASLFEEEVAEKTRMIPERALMQTCYKDRPSKSEHYWEHLDTRLLG